MLQRIENPRSDYLYRKGPYLYFRFPGKYRVKPVGLPPDEGSAEFRRAYDRCEATLRKMENDALGPPLKIAATRTPITKFSNGTIARAVELYLASKKFESHKPSTQRIYRGELDRIKAKIGDGLLRDLDRDAVEDFVEHIYNANGSASMADLNVTVINNVWNEVRKNEQFDVRKLSNPTIEIDRKHKERHKKPHLAWNDDVQEKFEDTAPECLALAGHVLHFSVQRGGDAVRMKWIDYDGKGIKVWPQKTTAKGAVLDPQYHLLPAPLIRLLDEAKKTATAATILVNRWGKPWTNANGLSQAIRRHLVKVGVRKKGVKGPGMHGLRHSGGSEVAALPGVGVKGIMSLGWKSPKQAMHYAAQADKARINAQTIAAWNAELEAKEKAREVKRTAKRRAALKVVK